MKISWLVIFLSTVLTTSQASDRALEQHHADDISQRLVMGNVVWLGEGVQRFFSLYTQTTDSTNQGTAIILHDVQGNPDHNKLIHTLRTRLPEHRWATLAIQLPILDEQASYEDYYSLLDDAKRRISEALDYLDKGNVNNTVIIGYGMGALMGLYALQEENTRIKAIVTISLHHPDADHHQVNPLEIIGKIRFPMLDIYAENDLPDVLKNIRKRKLAARTHPHFRQDKLNTNHRYQHYELTLSKRIYTWLTATLQNESK